MEKKKDNHHGKHHMKIMIHIIIIIMLKTNWVKRMGKPGKKKINRKTNNVDVNDGNQSIDRSICKETKYYDKMINRM